MTLVLVLIFDFDFFFFFLISKSMRASSSGHFQKEPQRTAGGFHQQGTSSLVKGYLISF